MAEKTFYVTTPIFYPNAKLHLGHAYTTTLCDILARYHRLLGEKTYFLTGSDENTQKMVEAARKEGKEPLVFLDEIVSRFSSLFKELDISYNQFIRTTDQKVHWPGAQKLWTKLVESDDIYKKEYEGLYCVGHEAFITEKDLVDGKCPDHGTAPEFLKEENYFFKLSKYTESIKEKITSGELDIYPQSRRNEILALLEEGLQDVSFSRPRKADWPQGLGVPVPGDDSQVMYVWCDALANYITALGYANEGDLYKEFWPATVQVLGKDILRFHAAIWPAMLISAGVPLPKALLVHGFITSGGKKMSKTLGNVIDPEELLAEYGTDAVRYFLARHISPFEDGDITREAFKDAYNADLANGLGNVVARVMKLAETNLSEPVQIPKDAFHLGEPFCRVMETFDVQKACETLWGHIEVVDRIMQLEQPFKQVKSDDETIKQLGIQNIKEQVIWLARIGTHLKAMMPQTAEKILKAVKENKMPESLFPRKE